MTSLVRSGYNVQRFHAGRRIQAETVGHHSANLCAILLELWPDCSRDLLVAGLMHDVAEGYTGDIPYPVKADHPSLKASLGLVEAEWYLANDLPVCNLTDEEYRQLKIADMFDLILSSREEINMGNTYAADLINNGIEFLKTLIEEDDELWLELNRMIMAV